MDPGVEARVGGHHNLNTLALSRRDRGDGVLFCVGDLVLVTVVVVVGRRGGAGAGLAEPQGPLADDLEVAEAVLGVLN